MEIRNIQKTGDMHYLYLPTAWCREHNISSKSKISIEYGTDDSLVVSPQISEKKPKHLKFSIAEDKEEIIHQLVVASYINPASSFEINMQTEMDVTKLLNQKRLISLESVEIDKKQITSEGAVTLIDPSSLLKTMIKKIKNMIIVMCSDHDKELIQRYEDEIDRSKMLIDKSVIGSLTIGKTTNLRNIDLYYASLISKELERMVDRMICLDKGNVGFLKGIKNPIEILHNILHDISSLDLKQAIEFANSVLMIKKVNVKDVRSYDMEIIRQKLTNIGEVIMDWMVTLKIQN
jgi:phosphate uptake regulator